MERMIKNIKNQNIIIVCALALAVTLKTVLVAGQFIPFNSDEAVVALMARHILQGERPIFFYGQAYMGSLDAWLIAAGFWLFSEHVWVIRLVQGLLYGGTLLTTVKLGTLALGDRRIGTLAAWLLAIPTVTVTLYTTASLGGYGECLLMGNLILILGLIIGRDLQEHGKAKWIHLLCWGILAGGGLWVFGLTLVYSLPTGLYLLWKFWHQGRSSLPCAGAWIFLGSLIGSAPWWIFGLQHGLGYLLIELGGGGIADIEQGTWLSQVGTHLLSLILFGGTATFGLRPSWELRWLALPLLPFILAFWLGVVVYILRRMRRGQPNREGASLLLGVLLTLSAGFVFTPFGADPSGRYFVPLTVPLSLFAAELILRLGSRKPLWGWGLAALVVAFNLWGTVQSAVKFPPGITTQFDPVAQIDHRYMNELIAFLQEHGESRGYTNYWVTYPLAFQSGETLIYTPRLPYHEDFRYTERDDRYAPYNAAVAQAQRVAYITTNHPALNDHLRQTFASLGVTWQEQQIGDYHVFYQLSRSVHPQEIGLGANCCGKIE